MANPRQLPPTLIPTQGYWSAVLQSAHKYMIRPAAPLALLSASLPHSVPEYPGKEMGKNLEVDKTFRTTIRISFGDYERNEGVGEAYIGALTPGLRNSITLNHVLYPGTDYILEAFGKAHIHLFGKFDSPMEVNVAKTVVRVFRRMPTRQLKPQSELPTPEAVCEVLAAAASKTTTPAAVTQVSSAAASQPAEQGPIRVKEEESAPISLANLSAREGGWSERGSDRGDGSVDGRGDRNRSEREYLGRDRGDGSVDGSLDNWGERSRNERDYLGRERSDWRAREDAGRRGRDDRDFRDRAADDRDCVGRVADDRDYVGRVADDRDYVGRATDERDSRRFEERNSRDRRFGDRWADEIRYEGRERRFGERDRWEGERGYFEREAADHPAKRFRREH